MQRLNDQDLYRTFIEFVRGETERDRLSVNRRMFSVFFWCFLIPTLTSAAILLLIKFGILPRRLRAYLDWLIVIFPVSYSIYFLSFEVLREAPKAFRVGGVAISLEQAVREGEWRHRVSSEMRKVVSATSQEWHWIVTNYRMDLANMQTRTRYLTALAGAVFFLIMQGIDSIADTDRKVTLVKSSLMGWVETSNADPTQYVGLALFLVMLYLSGSQTYQALHRYLNCAELAEQETTRVVVDRS